MIRRAPHVIVLLLLLTGCLHADPEFDSNELRIVGGELTPISELPWQVSLQIAGGFHFCGGAIVAPTWVATAARCLAFQIPDQVVGGITWLSDSREGQRRFVKRGIIHPSYTGDVLNGGDFALLELTTPFTETATVRPIRPISTDSDAAVWVAPGMESRVSGWGPSRKGGDAPTACSRSRFRLSPGRRQKRTTASS